jgi:adenylate kinase family enzyme
LCQSFVSFFEKIWVVAGLPACGKSTVARRIASSSRCTLIDSDVVADRLVRVGMKLSGNDENDRDSDVYKENYREAVYETMYDLATQQSTDVALTGCCCILSYLSFLNVFLKKGPFSAELRDEKWLEKLKIRLNTIHVEIVWVRKRNLNFLVN